MANWNHTVKIKHLFTIEEDHASVQASMNAVADVIEKDSYFQTFSVKKFRNIPQGDSVFGPVDYANKLRDGLFDFADNHLIWRD